MQERLRAIDNLDVDLALRNLGGGVPALERVLRTFVETYAKGAPELLAVTTSSEIARCRATCHSLRGACAVIGATRLHRAIESFESELKKPADSKALEQRGWRLVGDLGTLVQRLRVELKL